MPNPCNNEGSCTIKLQQIECVCKEKFFGKMCEFTIQDFDLIYSEYSRIISDLKPNLTQTEITKIDELNALINQNSSFATKNMTEQITNLTCKN